MTLKTVRPGEVLHGRDEVVAFARELVDQYYETQADVFKAIDARHVVVEGRIRWMDEARVIRDDPMIWAIELRDGLLWRSTPAQSVLEAEVILSTAVE